MMLLMEANSYFFLGLAAEAAARSDLRKSRLMLASNFLVGTRFSSSRFVFASIDGSLANLKSEINVQWCNQFSQPLEVIQKFIHKRLLRIAFSPNREPRVAAIWAFGHKLLKLFKRYVSSTFAPSALKLNSSNVTYLNNNPMFGGQFASLVTL